jgi:hypothetical protein
MLSLFISNYYSNTSKSSECKNSWPKIICVNWLVCCRYAWSHGITPRKTDVIPTSNGDLTIQRRGERTSFTFRSIRKGECNCVYHDQCDSYKGKYRKHKVHIEDDALAAKLESLHVHEVWTRKEIKCWYSKQCFIVPHSKNFSLRKLKLFLYLMHIKSVITAVLDWIMTFNEQIMWVCPSDDACGPPKESDPFCITQLLLKRHTITTDFVYRA